MTRRMAHRINDPLVEWPDGSHYTDLDYHPSERVKVWLGWAAVMAACLFIVLVLSLPGN
jgi:hypothetical protein